MTIEALVDARANEQKRILEIDKYVGDAGGKRLIAGMPERVSAEVRRLAASSYTNFLRYVVNSRNQHLYVEGWQTPSSADNQAGWDVWQRNRMDRGQTGVHRAALKYGAAYVSVMPGDPVPVLKSYSPHRMTAVFAYDSPWPEGVLIAKGKTTDGKELWRHIDRVNVTDIEGDPLRGDRSEPTPHGVVFDGEPVCPVVRFTDIYDLDNPVQGIVEPYMSIQDQIDATKFGMLVAQHYQAFLLRYIIGWTPDTEHEHMKVSASKMITIDENPEDIRIGEFQQVQLSPWIESHDSLIRHLATVSQTPVHELAGQFVNLSAEALEAARGSHQSAIEENRMVLGESWEQVLNLAAVQSGAEPVQDASVVWRDTRIRSLSEAATGLSMLVEGLGFPAQALWSKVPGFAQHELERAMELADSPDAVREQAEALMRAVDDRAGSGV